MTFSPDKEAKRWNANVITRRSFCQRVLTLGIIGSSSQLLLGSCGSPVPQTNILWHSEEDEDGSFHYLAERFSQAHPNIQVQPYLLTPGSSDSPHDDIVKHLQADQYRPDVISLDVVWVSEFVSNGWLEPLDTYWQPPQDRNSYLPIPLKVVKMEEKIWAAPLHTDIGVLFFRTDIVSVPLTWDDLKHKALDATKSGKTRYGYVWQGKQFEGLVCNWIEVLSSFGGDIFDPHDPQKVIVYSPEAVKALQTMVDWIHGPDAISPLEVLTYDESATTGQWVNGDAAFMRNWPSRFFWSSDARQTKIAEEFTVTQLPSKARSCLGGWQLAINKFSPHKDEAWTFIQWMLQRDAQQYLAVKEAFPVTLNSVYNDPYINDLNPFFNKLPSILQNAQWRPMLPYYPDISNAIQQNIHQALAQPVQFPPERALQNLQNVLERIVAQHTKKH
jgi:multiple sugar transport system substrate-binding protein